MKTSVALCTYNGEKFISQQIDSILNQSVKVDEIIICDDGSTDSTLSILEKYSLQFPNLFTVFQNEKNLKSVKNFEKAIGLCNYEIIFLCDQDDIWCKNKVELILKYFQENPNIEVLATNGYGIDEDNHLLDVHSLWDLPTFFEEKKIEINFFKMLSFVGNIATGASMAIRKTIVKEIVPFPVIKNFHHDEWIAVYSSSKDKFAFLNDRLFKYRIHELQQVGDVFLEKNDMNKQKLISNFDYTVDDYNFSSFKKILKRLSKSYEKNQKLIESNPNFFDKGSFMKKEIKNNFYMLKEKMTKRYPIQSFFLNFSDTIFQKRKLK